MTDPVPEGFLVAVAISMILIVCLPVILGIYSDKLQDDYERLSKEREKEWEEANNRFRKPKKEDKMNTIPDESIITPFIPNSIQPHSSVTVSHNDIKVMNLVRIETIKLRIVTKL